MEKSISSLTGLDIKLPLPFYEEYSKDLKLRKFGKDNLYPQQLKSFYRTSPTLNKCVNRLALHLFGEYDGGNSILTNKIVEALINDYALFNGCCLHVNYDGLGNIISVDYVPFESIRLCEQGSDGSYTQVWYCADWAGQKTINQKRVRPTQDKQLYFTFTSNIETRLRRIEASGNNYKGEMLYISNSISYPVSVADSVLTLVSAEIGIINSVYRDIRCNFTNSAIVSIPRGSELDGDEFADQLSKLQGDNAVGKILMYEYASSDEKPEVLSLTTENYDARFTESKDYIRSKIMGAYQQEVFSKLEDGSLGFSSDIVADAYKFYNFSLRSIRKKLEVALRQIDENFKLPELQYQTMDNNNQTPINNGNI